MSEYSLYYLLDSVQEAGRELLRHEFEAIRDNATAIELPTEIARDMTNSRGYQDIDAEHVWNEWLTLTKNKS
ncbi:hypothetical protein [Rahnella victoriana]|jgi:hypothetical protein|uniref:Uncharacterized protein n=1 Tax=Rahnella victoriana TaxID=1510570 RepID=A0ABS0DP76_9GAMM|nr:hypothetical protein [Rahnella victoriana]VTQ53367.1 Uncharacterised protein [Campylobacter jejuni]MBF7955615.1 hypothetical protein [Rahnella victoriana]PBI79059.1 hypothetical protein A9993_04670 [Rahnella victoriana]TBX37021.1 hypothetical protein EYY67_02515 [Rahnella victoriana]UHM90332.1 hypothetical protein J9880_18845 [Rahnella victoriana]